jgi:hypothetical protein
MRDILKIRRGDCGCCPGHDTFPNDSYKSRRSKKARSNGIKVEHRFVRRYLKQKLKKEILGDLL